MALMENKNLGLSSKKETLNILIYSDIFHYPLTKNEIYERGKISLRELEICLEELQQDKKIYLIGEFYSLHQENEIIENRIKRNDLAKKIIPKARNMAKIIANFPFIRGVFLSGSISKNCMDENSDIDFFIITEPGRLWIARLVCIIFRRLLFFNYSKYFCYNFLIDREHLTIKDQSIFTAIEIKTLVPLFGYDYYLELLEKNKWINDYFPKLPPSLNHDVLTQPLYIQKFLELVLDNFIGDWIDKWFLKKSIERRKKKLDPKLLENPNYYINFQKHIAKEHLHEHYPKVMSEYKKKAELLTY